MSAGWSYWAVFVPGRADICSLVRPNILGGRAGSEGDSPVRGAPGPASTTYYVLGRMLYIMHAALTVTSQIVSLSSISPTTSMMYSLQWRERGMWCAWADWCSLWFSLYSHTLHSTLLHSTPVYSSHIIWVRPEWSCMLGLAGPHYSHLSSCKHCNWEMIYPIRVQQSYSVLQSILCWPIKSS